MIRDPMQEVFILKKEFMQNVIHTKIVSGISISDITRSIRILVVRVCFFCSEAEKEPKKQNTKNKKKNPVFFVFMFCSSKFFTVVFLS